MLSAGMVHIFILKIKGCKNIKCHILYADVNKTTKYSACGDNSCTTSDRYVKSWILGTLRGFLGSTKVTEKHTKKQFPTE